MHIPLSTLLSRSQRQGVLVPFLVVSTVEAAEVIMQTAQKHQRSVVLVIDSTHPLPLPAALLIPILLHLMSFSQVDTSLLFLTEGTPQGMKDAIAAGAAQVGLKLPVQAPNQINPFLEWASALAHRHHLALSLYSPTSLTPSRLEEIIQLSGVQAVFLPVTGMAETTKVISLNQLQLLRKASKVALVAHDTEGVLMQGKKVVKAGLNGYVVSHSLEEAYTGGLHTGLRGSGIRETWQYLPTALKAVEKATESLFK